MFPLTVNIKISSVNLKVFTSRSSVAKFHENLTLLEGDDSMFTVKIHQACPCKFEVSI